MPMIPLLIGSTTALGLGYFCADLYRNRRRLTEKPVPEADVTCYEFGDIPTGKDLEAVGLRSAMQDMGLLRLLVNV